jgi:predicted phosphoribosyltransferase
MGRFTNRAQAGRLLAEQLAEYRGRPDVIVLALPRGGVPVALEVADALDAPLDVLIVRKLGLPGQEELAIGALASGGTRVLNEDLIGQIGLPADVIDRIVARESAELERREQAYREGRPAADVTGRVVIVVDDGLATGATMLAAVETLRLRDPSRIVVAVPTAPRQTCANLETRADGVVCLVQPDPFFAVGMSYADFSEIGDDEVRRLLSENQAVR